jgi:hypothetical protein
VTQTLRRRVGAVGAAIAGAGIVAAVVVGMAPAFACTVLAHIQTSQSRGDPGEVVRIDGSGFELHGNPVKVYWGGEGGALLATAPAPDGTFAVDVAVPTNALAGREYLIEAVQEGNPPHNGDVVFRTSRPAVAAAPTPAAAPAPGPASVAAPAVATAAAPHSAAAPQPAADPAAAPADASGFALSGTGAFTPSGQPVAPLVTNDRSAFGGRVHNSTGRSPWVLLPLGVLGLTLFSVAAASVVRQAAPAGTRATV